MTDKVLLNVFFINDKGNSCSSPREFPFVVPEATWPIILFEMHSRHVYRKCVSKKGIKSCYQIMLSRDLV